MMLIVGLGNPGLYYAKTRHNAGFQVIDRLAARLSFSAWRSKCNAMVGVTRLSGREIVLAKPQTYMNNSGKAIKPLLDWFGLNLKDLIVVCDDLDLPLGQIRIRKKGGDGGHRGLKSIISEVSRKDFARLRLGIGRPLKEDEDIVNWVLGYFSQQEMPVIDNAINRAVEALQVIAIEGLDKAMNMFN